VITRKIFFYWDNETPDAVLRNVENFSKSLRDIEVILLTDSTLHQFSEVFPDVVDLIPQISLPSTRSDLVRLMALYQYGGMWLDSNTTLIDPAKLEGMFDVYSRFQFVITVMENSRFDLKTSALMAQSGSTLAFKSIEKTMENLHRHFELEKKTSEYVPYNMFMFTAPVIWTGMIGYTFDDEFRNQVALTFQQNPKTLTLDLPKFEEYGVALMKVDEIVEFYGCNMDHHHEENFHNHWSERQKSQRLFY
jgi:hypothetical protein